LSRIRSSAITSGWSTYKPKIADYFEKVGEKVTWQKLGEGFDHHQFRFQVFDDRVENSRAEAL